MARRLRDTTAHPANLAPERQIRSSPTVFITGQPMSRATNSGWSTRMCGYTLKSAMFHSPDLAELKMSSRRLTVDP